MSSHQAGQAQMWAGMGSHCVRPKFHHVLFFLVYKSDTTPEPTANTDSHCDGSSKPEIPQELSCNGPSTSPPPLLPDKGKAPQPEQLIQTDVLNTNTVLQPGLKS